MISVKDCHIIVCGSAVGKTYLANHDDRFIDLDGEKARYKYCLKNISDIENERNKLNRGPIINHDSDKYIINLINKKENANKILLLSYQEKILNYIINNNIPYCLVYPAKELSHEYAQRMKDRGNTDEFVHNMTDIDIWNEFYKQNSTNPYATYKIELKKGQYLSDIIDIFED